MTQPPTQERPLTDDDLRAFLIAYRRHMLALASLIEKLCPEAASSKPKERRAA